MTGQDIIKAGKAKVRNSALLYPAYIEMFTTAFGYAPECPTCGSAQGQKDWSIFKHFVENNEIQTSQNPIIMENSDATFVIKDKNELYSYDYSHENGRVLRTRTYGYSMTEAFAKGYLENAKDEAELEERKNKFKVLPSEFEETSSIEHLTKAELKEILVEMGVDEADYKSLNKSELIALVEANQFELEEANATAKIEEAEDLN